MAYAPSTPAQTDPTTAKTNRTVVKPFQRAQLPIRNPLASAYGSYINHICPACHKSHPRGACELKVAGVEHCGLCGLAHYGHSRTCPHIRSETQVREMLEALKSSPEDRELVDAAVKYLRGVKGTLVQQKKRDREKAVLAKGQSNSLPTHTSLGHPPNSSQSQPSDNTNGLGSSGPSVGSANNILGCDLRIIQMQPRSVKTGHTSSVGHDQGLHAQRQMSQ